MSRLDTLIFGKIYLMSKRNWLIIVLLAIILIIIFAPIPSYEDKPCPPGGDCPQKELRFDPSLWQRITSRGSTDTPQDSSQIPWAEAVELIRSCQVTSVVQTHSLEVDIFTQDGRKLHTQEPEIDLVIKEARQASDKCGFEIIIATE